MNIVQEAIIRLLKEEEFYAHCILEMHRVKDDNIPTIGVALVGANFTLFYNEKYLSNLTSNERKAILKHEVLHVLNQHLFNMDNKKSEIWNVATDIAINQFIKNLPQKSLSPKSFEPNLKLEERKSAEYYYRRIIKETPIREMVIEMGKGLHDKWKESAGIPKDLAKELVKQLAKNAQSKSAGNIPGEIQQIIKNLFESEVNWRKELKRFVASSRQFGQRTTWKRVNRRFPSDAPGFRPKTRHRILLGIDTSGSISDKMLAHFNSEMIAINKAGSDIIEVQFDHQIQQVNRYRNRIQKTREHQYKGRGGTSFIPVFEWATKQKGKEKFDAVIMLTDGWGSAPDIPPPFPVLWVIVQHGDKPVKWGDEIKLEAEGL